MTFKKLEHITDLRYSTEGKTLDELFENITEALSDAIYESQLDKFDERHAINLNAKTLDMLIHDYIEELIYIANYEYKLFANSTLHIFFDKENEQYFLKGFIGIKNSNKKDYSTEVKACSFSIKLKEKPTYEAEFILDI